MSYRQFALIRDAAAALLLASRRYEDAATPETTTALHAAQKRVFDATTCRHCADRFLHNGIHCDGVCMLPSNETL